MLLSANKTPVFPISLGGAGIGSCDENIFFQGPVSVKKAVETVQFALENGINLLDTSPFYGNSEQKIGVALQEFGSRSSVILSTKAGTHPIYKGYRADNIRHSIDSSLRALRTDYLDVVHIHDPSAADFQSVMENDGMETLLRLKEEKVILNIGLGVRDHDMHHRFISSGYADVILPYLDYNVLCTTADALLNTSFKKHVTVMLGSALCMGLLSGKDPAQTHIRHYPIENDVSVERAMQMYQWCKKKNVNLMALNYKFILDHPAVDTIVIGAASKEEVRESLNAYKEIINPAITNSFRKNFGLS